ncbi:hypothetical protein [Nitrospirillum amazonense]|uniref:PepSY domain-containing protein n=1 Tax=Nitrospirillum amazonense TaxID=28077 RepID=A0A560KPH1_9PROT|nr:hypothetical protein [Nitrospirillum amazonense]MDG3443280.1 hypothetical protein [Nitrospirillum amazonense]TWB82580.1 hypothetical protein FBZ87_101288 [Nitrospirillum amazonense]
MRTLRHIFPHCATRLVVLLLAGAVMGTTHGALAAEAEAEAKSVALEASCKPNKVEAVQRFVGNNPDIVYKITCQNGKDLAVYVRCQGRTCFLVR